MKASLVLVWSHLFLPDIERDHAACRTRFKVEGLGLHQGLAFRVWDPCSVASFWKLLPQIHPEHWLQGLPAPDWALAFFRNIFLVRFQYLERRRWGPLPTLEVYGGYQGITRVLLEDSTRFLLTSTHVRGPRSIKTQALKVAHRDPAVSWIRPPSGLHGSYESYKDSYRDPLLRSR